MKKDFFIEDFFFSPIQGKKPFPERAVYFLLGHNCVTQLPLVAKKEAWEGEIFFQNRAYYFLEQIGIQLVRKKVRKDIGKANSLVSASKLHKHLLED